jgi:hypothetical protein
MICKKTTVVNKDGSKIGVHIWIWCPGCEGAHTLATESTQGGPVWTWNGSLDKPTFNPSLLVRQEYGEAPTQKRVCHSFIRDGHFQFLGDCTHKLAGKTVPLPDLPDWLE